MLFVEGRFFLFLALILGVHWSLSSHRARKLWLLLCSYAFYAQWDARFLGLIVLSTLVINTVWALRSAAPRSARRQPA